MAGAALNVDIARRFPRGPAIAAAFALDLSVAQTLVLFGPSGAGKTTVLRCLAGLERPDRGRIVAGGEVWFDAELGIDVSPQRRRVGYLPQGLALFPHLDVRANIAYGMPARSGPEQRARVAELVALLQLDGLERRRPGQLSGGQQQRVALARVLAPRPRLLLLDEPLAALDAPTRELLRGELRRLLVAGGVPAIVVTHDRSEALVLGDRVAVMDGGIVRQQGAAMDVFDQPADEAVARIVGVETVLPATVLSAADGLVRLRVGAAELVAVGDWPAGKAVFVSIRAEDVMLFIDGADSSGAASARNRLPGHIVAVEPAGSQVRVCIDCGFPLWASVTRPAMAELGLRPGMAVHTLLKAPAVHVIG